MVLGKKVVFFRFGMALEMGKKSPGPIVEIEILLILHIL